MGKVCKNEFTDLFEAAIPLRSKIELRGTGRTCLRSSKKQELRQAGSFIGVLNGKPMKSFRLK